MIASFNVWIDLDVPQRGVSPAGGESSGDSADDYVQQKKRAPKPKKRSKGRRDDEEDEGRSGSQRKRKRASKKKVVEEVDLSQLPPEVGQSSLLSPFSQRARGILTCDYQPER